MSIEKFAIKVDKRLEKSFFKTRKNKNTLIFSNIMKHMSGKYNSEQIIEIINYITYERYFGNFGNNIIKMVFQPSVMNPHLFKARFLNPAQVHDALHIMFILITQYNLNHKLRDYYGHTMAESIFLTIDVSAPDYIVSIGRSFYYLLKHGTNIVVTQQLYVKAWYERRKAAVRTLENWWLEIVSSPYTHAGQRNLQRLALAWYKKAQA